MRWQIVVAVLIVVALLGLFRDTPLVQAMGRFVGAIGNLLAAIAGLIGRLIASI